VKQEMTVWQWDQLERVQIICTLLHTDNHASTLSPIFYRPDALPDAQPTLPYLTALEMSYHAESAIPNLKALILHYRHMHKFLGLPVLVIQISYFCSNLQTQSYH